MMVVNSAIMKNLFLMPAVVVMSAAVHAAEWGTDYAVALAQAEREGKAVLVDFTGSDWCGYCIRLRDEVLEEPRFSAWAGEHFVLLEVDMPKNPHFDEDPRAQNQMLCKKYGVDSFPTLMVLDARGNALGALYGYEGNPDIVREILTRGLMVQGFLKKARQASGEEKLRFMVEAWRLLPEELQKLNAPLRKEIMDNDAEDYSGLRAEETAVLRLKNCVEAANAAPTDAAALDIVNAAIAEAGPMVQRQLLEHKFRLFLFLAETEEDVLAAAEVAYAAIDADLRLTEAEKQDRKAQFRAVFANPQSTLKRYRMVKRNRPKR